MSRDCPNGDSRKCNKVIWQRKACWFMCLTFHVFLSAVKVDTWLVSAPAVVEVVMVTVAAGR